MSNASTADFNLGIFVFLPKKRGRGTNTTVSSILIPFSPKQFYNHSFFDYNRVWSEGTINPKVIGNSGNPLEGTHFKGVIWFWEGRVLPGSHEEYVTP